MKNLWLCPLGWKVSEKEKSFNFFLLTLTSWFSSRPFLVLFSLRMRFVMLFFFCDSLKTIMRQSSKEKEKGSYNFIQKSSQFNFIKRDGSSLSDEKFSEFSEFSWIYCQFNRKSTQKSTGEQFKIHKRGAGSREFKTYWKIWNLSQSQHHREFQNT